ncbi:hypothetical protein [Cellulomonas gilvus]|uniref:Uncharacterized protein n=1 Tax=Cellulomonas gilvus (strain ATCC 13127 / NRRL B-14078) TaxID=593907 RepID=F8A4K0_CELGA|nr:hypothetical protein [Cellulomonas gilvus]AEI13248.1 hypothetical protein Celgi_2750 [Cellulomonas gilvus ATCC 13127]
MRYNPPPNWPAAPEGWQPPPDWQPDPSWPEPPPGWQLWVEGDAPSPQQDHRKGMLVTFWIGIALFLAGAISTIVASGSGGGVVWWGGMIFGAVLLFRAGGIYRASRGAGAPALSKPGLGVAAVAVVAALVVGGVAVAKYVEAENLTASVGSCWKSGDGDETILVPCSGSHEYRATAVVTNEAECPATTYGSIAHEGKILCVEED